MKKLIIEAIFSVVFIVVGYLILYILNKKELI